MPDGGPLGSMGIQRPMLTGLGYGAGRFIGQQAPMQNQMPMMGGLAPWSYQVPRPTPAAAPPVRAPLAPEPAAAPAAQLSPHEMWIAQLRANDFGR